MMLFLSSALKREIEQHGEACYPEEGAGMLLGHSADGKRKVVEILPMENDFAPEQRSRRYQIRPEDMIAAEAAAEERGLELIGVFHSHPDHPPTPSEFDRRHALPWFVYLITSVAQGQAGRSLAWRLLDDRDRFEEVRVVLDTDKEFT